MNVFLSASFDRTLISPERPDRFTRDEQPEARAPPTSPSRVLQAQWIKDRATEVRRNGRAVIVDQQAHASASERKRTSIEPSGCLAERHFRLGLSPLASWPNAIAKLPIVRESDKWRKEIARCCLWPALFSAIECRS